MKHLRLWAVLAALFYCPLALAQTPGAVTSHAFAVGKGAGKTGFTSVLCGLAQVAVGQTSADPICQSLSGDVTINGSGVTAIGANKVTLGMHATLAADSFIGNLSGSTATPAANAFPNCTGALIYNTSTHVLGCNNSAGTGTVTEQKNTASGGLITSGNCDNTSSNSGSPCNYALTSARQTLPTIQKLTSGTAATYTTPAGVLWIEVKMCGGGAGGVGGGVSPGTGTAGGSTVFGLHTATGGNPGTGGGANPGGTGGSGGTIGAGAIGREQVGGAGIGGLPAIASATPTAGYGGSSLLGFGAQGGIGISGVGASAPANSCGGGGGGGANTNQPTGAGGGGGDGLDLIIGSPVSTYTYTIGSGGTAGAAGTNGATAGPGGSGFIIVIEHYGS